MKSFTVSAERFKAIVDAYGADPKRWPQAERAAALRFMTRNPLRAEVWLNEARDIDALLDVAVEPVTDAEIEVQSLKVLDRVLSKPVVTPNLNVVSFPAPKPSALDRKRALPLLWTGIGLAACIAGASVGVKFGLSSIADVRAQTVLDLAQVDTEN